MAASGKGRGPDVWHARVLRDEAEALTAAVRILEYREGFLAGHVAGAEDAEWAAARVGAG